MEATHITSNPRSDKLGRLTKMVTMMMIMMMMKVQRKLEHFFPFAAAFTCDTGFKCVNDSICIPISWQCDGEIECLPCTLFKK